MITDSSFLPWQTWPEHPPVVQSLSAAQGLFVEVPQKAGSVGGGPDGAVSLVHAQVKIAAVNRRIIMCFICCYLTFWVYMVAGWLP